MKALDKHVMLHHRARSYAFYQAMRLLSDDVNAYGNAVALLAVHAAISLADAILIGCTGKRGNEQDHRAAIGALSRLCGERRINRDGIGHYRWLIEKKTPFSYGDRRLDPDKDNNNAMVKAERFTVWAYKYFDVIAKAGPEQ